jgi:parallel beta-helix repeat protein
MCVLNGVHGIDFGDSGNDSTVKGCSAHQNNCGIVFSSHCVAEDNLCSGNGSGIQAVMDQNRIDSNHTMYNNSYGINDYHGIDVFGALNLVVRNSSDDINYVSSPNISLGPIVGLGQGQIRSDTGWENFSLFGTYR